MDFQEFSEEERAIYSSMRRAEIEAHTIGIRQDQALMDRRGGFFLSFIHPRKIALKASAFSAKVGALVPAMIYDAEHVHTTAGSITGSVGHHFYFNSEQPDHRRQRDTLEMLAREVSRRFKENAFAIDFSELCILLPDIIIAPGKANEAVFDLTSMLVDLGKERGVPITPCRDGHMTVSRFTEAGNPKDLPALLKLVDEEPPFGLSCPIGISAGYTWRQESEREVSDLRQTPGHFRSVAFFRFE